MTKERLKIGEVVKTTGLKEDYIYRVLHELEFLFCSEVKKGKCNRNLYSQKAIELFQEVVRLRNQEGMNLKQIRKRLISKEGEGRLEASPEVMGVELRSLREQLQNTRAELERSRETERYLLETMEEARRRSDTIIMQLTGQVKSAQLLLEDLTGKREPEAVPVERQVEEDRGVAIPARVASFRAGEREKHRYPKESWGWLKTAWIHLFRPELLREY